MTKGKIFTGLLVLACGFEFNTAFANHSQQYDCEVKLLNSSANPKWFQVGDQMKLSLADPSFILPEFIHSNGALSQWNNQSHPTFLVENKPTPGFDLVLKRRFISGDFVEENYIEIEETVPPKTKVGAWITFTVTYGLNKKVLTKMYASCTP